MAFQVGDLVRMTNSLEGCGCGCLFDWIVIDSHEYPAVENLHNQKIVRIWDASMWHLSKKREKTGFGKFIARIECTGVT